MIIELDKTREIKYTLGSIRKGKQAFGVGLMQMMSVEQMGPDNVVDLLWIGLIHEEPGLTRRQLDKIIEEWINEEGNDLKKVDEAIVGALHESKFLAVPGVAEKNS
jgi:DNA polymerase/3'-5' exonuclease PolX